MELYKRILQLIDIFDNNSQTQAARRIGIPQKTLWGYLNEDGQVKIKKVFLDKIFEAYPGVRRDWLYFGEGEMLQGGGIPALAGASGPVPAGQPVQGSPAASVQLMLLDMRSDGWGSPAPIPALTALPELHDKVIAVVAPDGFCPQGWEKDRSATATRRSGRRKGSPCSSGWLTAGPRCWSMPEGMAEGFSSRHGERTERRANWRRMKARRSSRRWCLSEGGCEGFFML